MQDVIKKLKFKDSGIVLNAPKEIKEEFIKLGMKITFDKKTKSTNTLIFINNNQEFLNFLKYDLENIESDSVLWFAYPKGTSKIKTDINRDTIRVTAEEEEEGLDASQHNEKYSQGTLIVAGQEVENK